MFLKNLSFLPSCLSRKVFTRFRVRGFSSSSSSNPGVSVWWHLDSCPVPSGVSFSKVAPSITAALRANGIMGTIHIRAYGDFNSSEVDKEALNSTNISLYSITDSSFIKPKINTDGKNNTYKHFLMDLNDWISTNPPPVHLFLIFGYRDFSSNGILPRLRMSNYNILLACPGRPHVALCHAATIIWDWSSLLKGEDLTGKHFNYPPDGPSNSWYGNSIVPLENPFLVAQELHKSSQNAEIYKPSLDDIKLGEVSKSVSRQVMKILCSHSIGISMGDLRAELTMCDLPLVKRFYGHKKFSNFLVSIPHVQLEYLGEGDFWVRLVPSTTSAVKNKQHDGATTQKLHNEGSEGDDLKSFQSIPSQGKPIGENAENKHEFPTEVDEVCRNPFTSSLFSWISSFWTFSKSNADSQVDQSASHFEEPKSSDISFRVSVSVWWDFETCGIPSDISLFNVAPSIMGVLRANGIQGPIRIDAYGDVSQFSKIKQEALFLSGIDLHHIPGGKNKNKCFMDWLSQNPSNRHLFLISGDEDFDFSGTVHRIWWRRNDNVLLACPGKADGYVCKAATIVWQWSSVLNGKYLTGIYFKQPPYWYLKAQAQVPLEYPPEWYRNSKMPHENPFSDVEELTSSEIHEPSSYIKSFEVKEWISRKVREVLSSYPNGISIGDLNFQLRLVSRGEVQSIMGAGGGLCSIKSLSDILASIPDVQLIYIGDDNFCVRLIPSTTYNVKKKQWAIKNEQRDVNHSGMPDSLWDDVESFIFTSRGSRLLSRSRSREDLAHRLQKHGPIFFMSLTENKILQLVELLIVEKKWLEESPSKSFPFRLTKSVQLS